MTDRRSGLLSRSQEPQDSELPLFNLNQGRKRRDEGIARLKDGQSDAAKRWNARAVEWIEERAKHPGHFNADEMRKEIGPPPGHYNGMGGLWQGPVKRGVIVHDGWRQRQAANANGQWAKLYVGAAFARPTEVTRNAH